MINNIPESKRDMVLRMLITRFTNSATLESCALAGLDDTEKPLSISGKFHNENYTTTAGDFVFFTLPWAATNSDDDRIHGMTRAQYIEIAKRYGLNQVTMRLKLPDGYAPEGSQAEDGNITPWEKNTISLRFDGNTLFGEWDGKTTVLRVAVADYEKYRDHIKSSEQEEKTTGALKSSKRVRQITALFRLQIPAGGDGRYLLSTPCLRWNTETETPETMGTIRTMGQWDAEGSVCSFREDYYQLR